MIAWPDPNLTLFCTGTLEVDLVTYLDADLMFFSSPKAIYEELGDKSILVTEHRFPESLKDQEVFGRFNVQCQVFRNDEVGLRCLRRWREQCLEWCYDRLEDGKFADQKYLNEWPELYGERLVISKHPGVGVAPWNICSQRLVLSEGEKLIIGGKPVVFYHFAGFRILSFCIVLLGAELGYRLFSKAYRFPFLQYRRALADAARHVPSDRVEVGNRYVAPWHRVCRAFLKGGAMLIF